MTEDPNDKVDLYKDIIFRAIFGDDSTRYALKCLLNAVLKQAELPLIADLELGNPFQLPIFFGGKCTVLDLHAVDETGRRFDIEMQVKRQEFFGDRLFYYGAELYGTSLQEGEGYTELPKIVCVAFISFPISDSRPNLWFDKWQMHSTLGTGLGTDKMTNIFVRLPRVSDKETLPLTAFAGQLAYWVKILSSYSKLTDEEKLELSRSTEGFNELERRIERFFSTEEGKKVFVAQRKYDSWMRDIELEQERDRQARFEAERRTEEAERRTEEAERRTEEEKRRTEEAERRTEEAERRTEEEKRGREEDRRLYLERQKKMIVRLFKKQFGAGAELPDNWAEGRSCDDLEALADKIDECSNLNEVLGLFR